GPGRLPLVGPGTGPGRRRDRLLDPERHQHGHPDRRRERRPGAPILYGRLVPDRFEVRRGRLHPVRRADQATIINSAREMNGAGAYANGENKYPNDNQGFGRVTLDDALFFQGDTRGLTVDDHRSGINTGDTVTYNLAIGDSTLPVEVTLVWTDYPGTANCGPCLVNDLDLQVTAPDGTTYNGNQYMGF